MIKLISLNIEGDNHIDKDRFIPFLKKESPDVLCLQEVFEQDLPRIEKEIRMKTVCFYPMAGKKSWLSSEHRGYLGVAILSNHEVSLSEGRYYVGSKDEIPEFKKADDPTQHPNTINLVLTRADISVEDTMYTICTTHFCWTPEGSVTKYQLDQLDDLFFALKDIPEFVLCGDFNAPRGKETWNRIASKYTDNIPRECQTSIDQDLHRAPGLMYVVDGLFTTKEYSAQNVRLIDGVSDHMAVVGIIKKHG